MTSVRPILSPEEDAIGETVNTLDDIETARGLMYRLLGQMLAQPPDAGLLARLARLDGDAGPIGTALRDLAARAARTGLAAARTEHDALFIGVARGELLPYASYYLTGFLHERPLARLRTDLARLGFARSVGRSDPEDHIATICEVMASLVETGSAPDQAVFFARHLEPWASGFFNDLERAASADLYRPVGVLGGLMIDLDRQGFAFGADRLTANTDIQRGAA